MADDNTSLFAMESDDCLENRLNRPSQEQSRQLLEEFLTAFYRETLTHPEVEKVTIRRQTAE